MKKLVVLAGCCAALSMVAFGGVEHVVLIGG